MKLETIILINRAPFDRMQLQLGNENVYVLSGINGEGKTTILTYIVDALYELAKKAFYNEFEDKPNKYYRVSSNLYSLVEINGSIVYMRFRTVDGNNRDYIDIRGDFSQEDYDQLIDLEDKIQFDSIKSDLKNEGNVKYWSCSEKKIIQEEFSDNILTYFPAYRYEMPSYITDPYKIEIPYTTAMKFSGYLNNPIEVTSDLSNIANWIMDVVLDLEVYPRRMPELFNQINDVLTAILFSKVKCRTRIGIGPRSSGAKRIAVMKRDEDKVLVYPSIFSMSSGELALLCLFGELVKQADKNGKAISQIKGIVLVDEIEKHLHIKLQKETLPKLIKLFPNIQFIVSSHSPFFALGLQEEPGVLYSLIDLGENGIKCLPSQTEIYKEVYNMMVSENDRFAEKYEELKTYVTKDAKPIVLTEGKTDWKHLETAMKKLKIDDIDFELYKTENDIGDCTLRKLLEGYKVVPPSRVVIGIFDRDNSSLLSEMGIDNVLYKAIAHNVYAFAIPLVNEEEYGLYISLEQYYRREDLCKTDENGRRLFLGDEFFNNGNSKDGQYQTRYSNIQNKVAINGVIDEKVYRKTDLEQKNSLAMSKANFAQKVHDDDIYTKNIDFTSFKQIFNVIRTILNE